MSDRDTAVTLEIYNDSLSLSLSLSRSGLQADTNLFIIKKLPSRLSGLSSFLDLVKTVNIYTDDKDDRY